MIEPEVPENERRGIGDNQPPSPIEALVAEQRESQAQYEERRDEVLASLTAKAVTDRVSAGEAGDLLKITRSIVDTLTEQRAARTKPYREAADKAKAVFDTWIDPLLVAEKELSDRLNSWMRDEDARAAAQQAEQANLLGDINDGPKSTSPIGNRPSQAKSPVIAQGGYGTKVVKKTKTAFTVVDVRAVPDFILNSSTVHDAIISVAKSMARHNPDIPGIKKTTEEEAGIR